MPSGATLPVSLTPTRLAGVRIDASALGAWVLGAALVLYLALQNGGYGTIVRSEAGVAIWWITLLAALAGLLPRRIGRAGLAAILLLGGFAVWTGIGISWSQSAESSVVELGREATYTGILILCIAAQGRTAARHTIKGVACAIGAVTLLAVLSRLHPQGFPVNEQLRFLGATAGRRLSYPINYWNALAAFTAMGVPLFVALAAGARSLVGRAVAAGMLPLCALCLFLTVSRGGVLELAVALAGFLLLTPRRLEALGTLSLAGTGAAILVWAADHRPAVRTGLVDHAAIQAGGRLLLLSLLVCLGVALLQAAAALAGRTYERPRVLRLDRRMTARASLAALALALVIAIATGVPGRLDHAWHNFSAPTGAVVPTSNATVFSRLTAINGNGRYQYWVAAAHAVQTRPCCGIGPGTFQFWWASHATVAGAVLNAHSLYMETLAETGVVGLALLLGMLVLVLAVAVRRSLRAPDATRLWVAAAAAGFATFMAAAAIEWVWQLSAIVAAALALASVVLAGRDDGDPAPAADPPAAADPTRLPRWLPRLAFSVTAIVALLAISIPLAEAIAVRDSQNAAQRGDLVGAFHDALTAQSLEPYAGTPYLQQALVLEADRQFTRAAQAARVAARHEPTDWQIWLTLARIDSERGADRLALAELARARGLNRLGTLFSAP